MKSPNIWRLKSLINHTEETHAEINGTWVPARPIGLQTTPNRFKAAWLVFTGKADALIWPEGQ